MKPGVISKPTDQITGQWVIENQMTWSTSNGRVNNGLIKLANQNANIITSALSDTSNQANVESLLAKYHSHELYIDRNANRIADSGDILVARGYSTIEGITIGGGRGTFRQAAGVIKAFDDNNVVVGNLVIAQPGYF